MLSNIPLFYILWKKGSEGHCIEMVSTYDKTATLIFSDVPSSGSHR